MQVPSRVLDGKRPELPPSADLSHVAGLDDYIGLMKRCWHQDPSLRPTFSAIAAKLADIRCHYQSQPKVRKMVDSVLTL